ncbi:MAG: HIT family protein [Candidatus Hodarchaeales archaeon]
MNSEKECIFCKIVKGEIPCYKLYEDDETIAFLDINPATKGHSLVIPKSHADNMNKASGEIIVSVYKTVKKVSDMIFEKLNPDGYNVLQNNGIVAGQMINHLHVHIVPRYLDDGIKLPLPMEKATEDSLKKLHSIITE